MTSEVPISCSVVVESKSSAAPDICRKILKQLEKFGFEQDDIFAVNLAFEEAFFNAVKHGNKMDPTKKVKVDYSVNKDKVEILITDEGQGFIPEQVPDPRVGRNLFRPEGRGLLLIHSYMDIIKYNERGNGVLMVRYKEKPELPAGRGHVSP